ncbi:MAG: type IV pilus assembly protein PilM [Patescibacteria group bacterium]|jgi:type IV pilus assembly protein PilM|nr:type IV pilus assembly protein PilM [Patescibacteria group bacterium]
MSILSGPSEFFGLDIGSDSVRLVQLSKTNGPKKELVKYAYVPIDKKISKSDSKLDQQKLIQIITDLISRARLSTKNVVLGISSNKVFTTVTDIEKLAPDQINKAIHYQIDSLIPTPIDETKIDWKIIGDSPKDQNKSEVILSSVSNSYVEKSLDMIESIGLNVLAIEPDYFGLCRSLIVPSSAFLNQGILIVDLGVYSTDIAVVLNDAPRLMRTVSVGNESLVRAVSQELSVDENQSSQLIYKFGLSEDKAKGQIYRALSNSIELLFGEIEKSIKFFMSRYDGIKVSKIIVTGWASVIPELPLYISKRFNINVEIGNSWVNVLYNPDKQNELMGISHQFAVAVGLAERTND